MRLHRYNNPETGMAMVLVITILAALLGIAAIGLSLQLNSTKSTALAKNSRAALFCAEAGIAEARQQIINGRTQWNDILAGTDQGWYNVTNASLPLGITGDVNGDGVATDFSVVIKDDGDDLIVDQDSNDTVIVTSTCLLFPTTPASVIEILSMVGSAHSYRNQAGQGPGNTGNAN